MVDFPGMDIPLAPLGLTSPRAGGWTGPCARSRGRCETSGAPGVTVLVVLGLTQTSLHGTKAIAPAGVMPRDRDRQLPPDRDGLGSRPSRSSQLHPPHEPRDGRKHVLPPPIRHGSTPRADPLVQLVSLAGMEREGPGDDGDAVGDTHRDCSPQCPAGSGFTSNPSRCPCLVTASTMRAPQRPQERAGRLPSHRRARSASRASRAHVRASRVPARAWL